MDVGLCKATLAGPHGRITNNASSKGGRCCRLVPWDSSSANSGGSIQTVSRWWHRLCEKSHIKIVSHTYSNYFCYILLCNRQSICFMASEDFGKLRTSSPAPSTRLICTSAPSITPSFVAHGSLSQRSAAHISRSCSAGRLACIPVSLSTPFRPPKFLPRLGLLCVTFSITASTLSSQGGFSDLLTDLINACN